MKKITYLIFSVFLLGFIGIKAQVTNTVTFQADLTDMIAAGFSTANGDTVKIEGLIWDDKKVEITGDPNLTLVNGNIYSTTLTLVINEPVGDTLRWKFRLLPGTGWVDGGWEAGDGTYYEIQNDNAIVTLDARKPLIEKPSADFFNIVTFKADLTTFIGTGAGFFDPEIDGIEVRGFWDENGTYTTNGEVIEGDIVMVRNLDPGVVYETTLKIAPTTEGQGEGATTGFKFKTFPDARWGDGGWETTAPPTKYTFGPNGAEVVLDARVPDIIAKGAPLGKDVNVLFQCSLPANAINVYDSSLIPRDEVSFIILKGDNPAIGAWAGNWVAADTVSAGAIALYDKGTDGDKTAGDYVFSRIVTFGDSITSGAVIFKFGAQYPAAGTISGSNPLDNSKASGANFTFNLQASDEIVEVLETWPSLAGGTDVKEIDGLLPAEYVLEQNYPNPFNPSTSIRYSVPVESKVSLKIFDMLGREVAELVNQNQASGNYEAKFDASRLASGIYFYRLAAGRTSISKKMMLLK